MTQIDARELMERLTLGLPTTLEKRPGICDVRFSDYSPTPRHTLVSWEQRNTCMLPDDLKNFYLTTDGMLLTWKVKIGDNEFPLGRLEINPIADLAKLSTTGSTSSASSSISLADVDYNSDSEDESNDQSHGHPHFDGRSRIFELDSCNGFGKVCLVYIKATPGMPAQNTEIWFLDRALNWSFLAKDFTTYYRLMLVHIGLPQWQYAFTPIGLSPKVKQWFSMYAPIRLKINEDLMESSDSTNTLDVPIVKVDWQRVFKGKLPEKLTKGKGQGAGGQGTSKKKQPVNPSIMASKSMTGMRHGRSTKPWT
uniref:Tubulin polyglutamylase complex subunit 2-like n=1 Tax=Phallusia mammillata TaxID=59560 RepID=A0A6F9D7E4_9ASCI|nr:tubulin polyglutamylase complex subunit 2-like [Phallusia mammillata]